MTPNYVAKKSMAKTLNFWLILFFWLIVPLIIQIVRILQAKSYSIEFYDEKMIVRSGVLNKSERQSVFAGVYAVSINQSLWGRMFNFGDIMVDCPGRWDVSTSGIKDPKALKAYLETKISAKGMNTVVF